ncbi:glycoside hydrolase family 31 protein [Tumebacillus flagellatus]|uniref:Alpha-glucosidase n=1 Tax=Tumebacillus flagellatus TaxID=1157490 RepID=A0A074LP71_9BACL|nr:glycoside hydrolase family 31 protein [Tumebacillus flagellatus]KEO81598.1 alpha-glucosidase [Tumebacillus flagellatus]
MEGSETIKPEYHKSTTGVEYISVGDLRDHELSGDTYLFSSDNAVISVQFLTDRLFRFKLTRKSRPLTLDFSRVIEPAAKASRAEVVFTDGADAFELKTAALTVTLTKAPFAMRVTDARGRVVSEDAENGYGWTKEHLLFTTKKSQNENFYGFGEKTGHLNKKGTLQSMWNTDVYAPHVPEITELYQSIPFFLATRGDLVYGVFLDNPGKTEFDLNGEDTYKISCHTGDLEYYFLYGPTMKDVVGQYTFLTGRMPIPPKWAIGYHQSRYSYETDLEVRELAQNFRNREIPCDVIYLDIHYMDEYRVFTWHPTRFPQPKKLLSDLRADGFRVVPIVDPGVKKDAKYIVYREGVTHEHFCKYLEGETYHGVVWPGVSAFPDFTNTATQKWWGEKHAGMIADGIEGIWNDMNEPAIFNETKTMDLEVMHGNDGDPKTHGELHNHYGLLMSKATYEGLKEQLGGKRPFVLTRAGYSSIQKYAAVWTGDNRSFWEHLSMSVPMILNMGLSGIAFAGADVGGFAHHSNGELLARWTQVGAFLPYFRNHSAIGFARQEPWSYGEEYEAVIKQYIEMRYVFLPHLYTLFREASVSGMPVVRPLVLEYPQDPKTHNMSDQFLFGDSILIAPIMQPDTDHRAVYLPAGTWIDYHTGEVLEGGRTILAHAPIHVMPMYVKEGAVFATGNVVPHSGVKQDITFHVYAGNGSYRFYEDDAETFAYEEGAYNLLRVEQRVEGSQLVLSWTEEHSGYESADQLAFHIHHRDGRKETLHAAKTDGLLVVNL